MIVILRLVVVGWEVLLIEVQAVALSLEAKLLVQDHEGHVLTTALLGSSTLLGRGGGRRCGTIGDHGGGGLWEWGGGQLYWTSGRYWDWTAWLPLASPLM